VIVQNSQDALSDILSALDTRALFSVRFSASGAWSVAFPPPPYLKFNAIRQGSVWVIPEGQTPILVEAGDCLVVSQKSFTLCSDPSVRPIPASAVFADGATDVAVGQGDEFVLLGGSVTLDTVDGGLLTDALPPVVVIRHANAGVIGFLLEQLDVEWKNNEAGVRIACNDILRLIFIHVLRAYMQGEDTQHPGWLAGLADKRLAPALRAMHAEPARLWRVGDLARITGQSRSSFAERFRAVVGASPIDYLAAWRIRLAAARLRRGDEPLPRIAHSLGYASDSAFAAAFRRLLGQSPARYRIIHRRVRADGEKDITP
jgi:AraC-like DNA-binding protein